MSEAGKKSFTGLDRKMTTRRSVLIADRVSTVIITLGGWGTIAAVFSVCAFLLWVVVPLFRGASVEESGRSDLARADTLVRLQTDEYRVIGWTLDLERAVVTVFRLDGGDVLQDVPLGDGVTAAAFSPGSDVMALGYADGTIRLGTIGFETTFLPEDADLPPALRTLRPGGMATHDGGVVQLTPENQLRLQRFAIHLREPVATGDAAVRLLDVTSFGDEVAGVYTEDGVLHHVLVYQQENFATGELQYRVDSRQVDVGSDTPPRFLAISDVGDNVFLAWTDGRTRRYDVTDLDADPRLIEDDIDLTPDGGDLTALVPLLGRTTLLAGDSRGHVGAWFRTKPASAGTADGNVLVRAHDLAGDGSPVSAISSSERTRSALVGHANGVVDLFQVTTARLISSTAIASGDPVETLCFAPKQDAILAADERSVTSWDYEPGHPEATFSSMFAPVWYEGDEKPENIWQSSSGTDDFEPKLGLVPLVFGSIKATIYSLLFGVPIALLAALYTSEFLRPAHRARIKPMVEMMASLPSVVLGFFAGVVIAPMVEGSVPQLLATFLTVPFSFLLGALIWQALPLDFTLRHSDWRLPGMGVALVAGLLLSLPGGHLMESWFFAGDIMQWLDGEIGSGVGAWMFLLFPLSGLVAAFVASRAVNPRIREATSEWPRHRAALAEIAKFLAVCLAAVLVAWVGSVLLDAAGWDPRGTYVDTYVQRNALIVGFIMGFAIIPIIYTIAEDALNTVPDHLRAASLGAGATPWQTAVRIIVPTAMSGLFSAVMIGLGRAVGETMIVLMAAGNTPVMDWNMFNGFRTLSANIAVELPEAVRDSTHYRTLFLAALTLFAMTFVLNTIAERVRQKFRRRAHQL